jgi:hypothetical protein
VFAAPVEVIAVQGLGPVAGADDGDAVECLRNGPALDQESPSLQPLEGDP